MPGNPKDSPSVKDRASEVSEVLEYGHRVLQFQDLLFLVFEKRQGKTENDLWEGQGSVRSTMAAGVDGPPGPGRPATCPRHVTLGTVRALSYRKVDCGGGQHCSHNQNVLVGEQH